MTEVSPAATHADVGVSRRSAPSPVVLLFSTTLFVSAFLLFLVEPIVARMILPILGGAPMVWNGCVLFFQILLLAGYAYTHGANTWLGPRLSAAAYAVLLLVPFAFLPFVIDPGSATVEGHPLAWLLLVLLGTIGAPFFVLASTTSALQKAFSETSTDARRDPYFLYIASNAGSLLGLLSYPLLVEPNFTLAEQSRFWSVGYGAFVVLALVCVATAWRMSRAHAEAHRTAAEDVARPGADAALTTGRRARWVALSAIPSSLMLGVTGYLTTDIASFPLLWVVPLALYLLTFILAFAKPASSRAVADRRLPILLVTSAVFILLNVGAPIWLVLLVHLGTFVLAALLCHSALADDRPPASQLTEFYLWIAVGGVIGGVFNTLIAPVMFNNVAEYPIALVLAAFFRQAPANATESRSFAASDLVAPAAIAVLTFGSILGLYYFGGPPNFAFYLPAFLCFQQLKHVRRFAMMVAALLFVGTVTPFGTVYGQVLMAQRTFFGVYRVSHHPSGKYFSLHHGTTLHGLEVRDPAVEHEPLVYFHREGPFGQAFSRLPNASTTPNVAVIGLGIGALASYAGPDQHWTFFEIDPFVEEVARDARYFTFLQRCGARCTVVTGDARLSIERQPAQYGLFVLDAFSSDAIPVHLMTSEALDLYLSRLAPGGVLAFHISNRHLSLGAVIGRLAAERGLTVLEQLDQRAVDLDERGMTTSNWLVMARDRADLGPLAEDPRWTAPNVPADTPVWTDDFSNILSVFRRAE